MLKSKSDNHRFKTAAQGVRHWSNNKVHNSHSVGEQPKHMDYSWTTYANFRLYELPHSALRISKLRRSVQVGGPRKVGNSKVWTSCAPTFGNCILWHRPYSRESLRDNRIIGPQNRIPYRNQFQSGILNILQPYRPPWPVTGIALLYFFTENINNYCSKDLMHLGESSK
jgi:hypothetical protein